MMAEQSFDVPLIANDLRREETIQQVADALVYIDKVSNDIFERISESVKRSQAQLQQINKRAELAAAKINKLKGSNRATKVFSSAKFPGKEENESYESIFKGERELLDIERDIGKLTTSHQQFGDEIMKEKLQFYRVLSGAKASSSDKNQADEEGGLGRLPTDITDISSLILFNTSENPYKKYVILDPLGVTMKTRAELEEQGEGGIGAAPTSISEREELARLNKASINYMPEIGEVPGIDVPLDLPDLPGVAGDVIFGGELGPSIAPSVDTGSLQLPEPDVTSSTGVGVSIDLPPVAHRQRSGTSLTEDDWQE